ncbi:transmembrane protein 65-like isoform X1 [Lineus longissimus]|uniref:transmembrane protein 65-like isoform X1 n=1 Tax=Lineus longissimus TaxID=88925 RepID=UPI00315D0DC9
MATSLSYFRRFGYVSRTFSWTFVQKSKSECKYQSIRVPIVTICRKCSSKSDQEKVKAPGLGEHQHHKPRHDNWAKDLIYSLDSKQRMKLMNELSEFEKAKEKRNAQESLQPQGIFSGHDGSDASHKLEVREIFKKEVEPIIVPKLSFSQKRQLAIFCGLPFVGFGTLDNIVMITAGEYIDNTFGAFLGLSTMAAAALGNMVSDVAGIGTAGYVEEMASKIGILPPELSPEQVDLKTTKLISTLGRMIGVAIGCTIGMAPLLLISRDDDEEEDTEAEEKSEESNPERTEK